MDGCSDGNKEIIQFYRTKEQAAVKSALIEDNFGQQNAK